MILVGELSLWVALLMAAWSAVGSFAGAGLGRGELVASGERASYAAFAFVLLASIGLCGALMTSDFSLRFVASHTSSNLPNLYKLAAFWGGASGSLLLWALMLSMCGAITVFSNRGVNRAPMPWSTGTLGAVLLYLLVATVVAANPYERVLLAPQDGRGLLPELQRLAMALHPPVVCLGLAATTVPFALAIGALVTRRFDEDWLRAVRAWSLLSWFFLTIGIALGMWWAYNTLGWGGVWSWDPSQNMALLPWLTNTAFLHSLMAQEKRGMFRQWNIVLAVATFLLAIFGAFIMRSGALPGIHGYSQDATGNWFGGLLVVALGVTTWLVLRRRGDLRSAVRFESRLSREAALAGGNVVLVGIAVMVLCATVFPMLGARLAGTTFGRFAYFNAVSVPLGLLLLALMGVGPLVAWRRASRESLRRLLVVPGLAGLTVGVFVNVSGVHNVQAIVCCALAGFVTGAIVQEFALGVLARRFLYGEPLPLAAIRLVTRTRRRYGGYVVHFGFVVLCAGLAGSAFRQQHDVTLAAAQTFSARDPWGHAWTFMSLGISNDEGLNRVVRLVALVPKREGRPLPIIRGEVRQHVDALGEPTFSPLAIPGILHTWREDVYAVFRGVSADGAARVSITFNPLVLWDWCGGIVMVLGGLIVMWPPRAGRHREAGYVAEIPPATANAPACEGGEWPPDELARLQAAVRNGQGDDT